MKDISINLSGKIDTKNTEILCVFDEVTVQVQISYVIVGATARDMVLYYGFGGKLERATDDIDFAIQVRDWDQFVAVREALLKKGFQTTKTQHRLIGPGDIKVDIVPFGGIETAEANIEWPPTGDTVMNVLGFQEACDSAIKVRISEVPLVEVPVVTPQGMTLLKLVAWTDRAQDLRIKDAKDFVYLLKNYGRIPPVEDELYDSADFMEGYGWDMALGGAHLLGVHAAQIASPQVKRYIRELYSAGVKGLQIDRLIEESLGSSRADNVYEENFGLAQAYLKGFESV